jgi:cell wall-associated NlpC family hydrolase
VHSPHRLIRLLACAVIAIGVLLPATAASADPTPEQLEQQIQKAHDQLEHVIEDYNRITEELAATRAASAALEDKLKGLQGSLDSAQVDVGKLATSAYKSGGTMAAAGWLLSAPNSSSLAHQAEAMERVTRSRQRDLTGYAQAKSQYEAEKKRLADLLTAQTQQQKQIADKKAAIEAELKRLEAMEAQLPSNRPGNPSTGSPKPPGNPPSGTGKGAVAVRYAYAQIGKMYVFGAAGPNNFDCSGLTQMAWKAAGVGLPHNAAQQFQRTPKVSRGNLQPGDLVYYNNLGHVGIYIGNNQIIHASRTGKPVAVRGIDVTRPYGYSRPG